MCLLPLEIFDISNQLMYKCVGQFHLPAFTLIRQPATENKYHYFWELTKACEMRRSHIMFKKGNSRGWDPFLIAWSVGDFLKTLGIYFMPKMRSLVYVDQGIPKVETVYKQAFSLHRHPRWKKDYYGHLVTYANVLIIRNKPVLCGYVSKKEPMRKAMDTSLISNSQKIKELILTFNHSSRKTQRTEQRT
jgi:hypothetical protein